MDKQIKYTIRPLREEETYLLRDFLYEAIYIPEGVEPPTKEVIDIPELKIYIEDFGKDKDDYCLVAETDHKVIGAVWVRIMNDYGHIDNNTPSLSISLYREYRNKGIGTELMKEMLKLLRNKSYHQVSLSVQKANYATNMYLELGFNIIRETDEEFIMIKNMNQDMSNYKRFLSGELCNRLDAEVLEMITQTKKYLSILNNVNTSEDDRKKTLGNMLGEIGKHSSVGNNL